MNKTCLVTITCLPLILITSCRSPHHDVAKGISRKGQSSATLPINRNYPWRLPADLPVLGTQTENSIRVFIFGRSIKHPGCYYLKKGSTVHDAIKEAGGLNRVVGWCWPYSGIQREFADGPVDTRWFTPENSLEEGQLKLSDGDRLRISHEVY